MFSKGEEETEAVAGTEHLQEVRDEDAGLGHRQARRPAMKWERACRARSGLGMHSREGEL